MDFRSGYSNIALIHCNICNSESIISVERAKKFNIKTPFCAYCGNKNTFAKVQTTAADRHKYDFGPFTLHENIEKSSEVICEDASNIDNDLYLFYSVESYLGKKLTEADVAKIHFFVDKLHFSTELIIYLIRYCVNLGKKNFSYIENVAKTWSELGIITPEQADKYSSQVNNNIYSIMTALGKNEFPSNKDLEYINRWIKKYEFEMDIILEACNRTICSNTNCRLEYTEAILKKWKSEGIRNKKDIELQDNNFRKNNNANKFNNFKQNTYDFETLEKEILSNNNF